jgi:hypothetical protein
VNNDFDQGAYRALLLTGNNPDKLICDLNIDFDNASEADYRKALELLLNRWICPDDKHAKRSMEINGFAAVFERGEGGTPHAHMLLYSKNPMRVRAITNRFPGWHIDIVRGSIAEALDYIFKRGKHSDKAFTTLCNPLVWGNIEAMAGTGRKESGEKVYDLANRLIREGMNPNQIVLACPKLARFENMVEVLYAAYVKASVPSYRKVKVTWHLGMPGSGKTYTYIDLCRRYGEDNVYLVSCTTKHPWDGYNETCKKIVLDELRPSTFSTGELLTILDGYKTMLGARYRDRLANWDEVHVTSVVPPEAFFPSDGGSDTSHDTVDQLMRRIDSIVYHYVDNSLKGAEKYKRLEIDPDDYRGLEDLAKQVKPQLNIPSVAQKLY